MGVPRSRKTFLRAAKQEHARLCATLGDESVSGNEREARNGAGGETRRSTSFISTSCSSFPPPSVAAGVLRPPCTTAVCENVSGGMQDVEKDVEKAAHLHTRANPLLETLDRLVPEQSPRL